MREVVACIHPIGFHSAKILNLELNKRGGKFCLVSEVARKLVGLELEPPAHDIHQQLDDRIHRSQCIGEENEADDDGMLLYEAKVGVQRVVVDEDREKSKNVEDMQLVSVSSYVNWVGMIDLPVRYRRDGWYGLGSSVPARALAQQQLPLPCFFR
jgi:hypothetical protein